MKTSDPTPGPALDHAALGVLVQAFYTRVRADDMLGPVFDRAIAPEEWQPHLTRMADFWSSVMLGSGRYHGQPMAAHLRHRHDIAPEMFDRWLALWQDTAEALLSPADAEAVIAKARRIAESLGLALFFRLPATV
ncbi:MAG: group III truncated hemoglobin [Sphingomonadales bacterium]|nr:group III truncated hemoglobin [Sphingomonadales bacterium]MDE2171650.1 group III truncated hemoglobin [Sphingomonadales bacterium]